MSSSTDSNAIISLLVGREPSFTDRHDAVMFVIHTHMLRKHFMCVSINQSTNQPTDQSTRELSSVPNGWNANGDAYQFRYIHSENDQLKVSLTGLKMGRHLSINALVDSLMSPINLDVNVDDFTNQSDLKNYRALYKDLAGLLALFDSQILSKIMPSTNQSKQSTSQSTNPSTNQHDPLRVGEPRRPQSLYEDDNDNANRLVDPRYRRRGDFDGDLNPLGGQSTGNLMGPRNFPYGGGRGTAPDGIPGLAPRFDPYGPMPGMGDPDFDELLPPGPGGVPGINPNRRINQPPFGGRGGFGGGFPPGPGGYM